MLLRFLSFIRSLLAPKPKPASKSPRPRRAAPEPLESRIAPATFVNSHVVTYTDVNGNHVTIDSSLPIFTASNFNTVLTFAAGMTGGQQLEEINLASSSITSAVAHDNLSVTVQKGAGLTGLTSVGAIEATVPLGVVTIQGDLGAIQAGSIAGGAGTSIGLSSLTVYSLGADGTATQASGGTLASNIYGAVGSITIQQNMVDAQLSVHSNTVLPANGSINILYIGGSLIGGADTTTTGPNPTTIIGGNITTDGAAGSVVIEGNLQGGVGTGSASLDIGGKIGSLSVNNIVGYAVAGDTSGLGQDSATISTGGISLAGGIGSLTIKGNLQGGDGGGSAEISQTTLSSGSFGSVKIGGSIIGGSGGNSGNITTSGAVGSIVIGGNLQGGSGTGSASLNIGGNIGSLSVDNIIGYTVAGDTSGLGQASASISTGSISTSGGIGFLTVKGNLQGGDGSGSGEILQTSLSSGTFAYVNIGGAIIGGSGDDSGELSAHSFGSISVGQGITGSSGANSGSIDSGAGIAYLDILSGGIVGGTNTDSGAIIAGTTAFQISNIYSIAVHGDITGDPSAAAGITGTGQIQAGSITYFNLYGSLVGSTAGGSGAVIATGSIFDVLIHQSGGSAGSILGGAGSNSGEISSSLNIGYVSVAGEILGSSGSNSGQIQATGSITHVGTLGGSLIGGTGSNSGEISAASIGSVSIAGQLVGSGASSGAIVATGSIESVTVGLGIIGGGGAGSGVVMTGSGTGFGNNLTYLTVTHGGITGGMGDGSGQVSVGGSIGYVQLDGGALTGGAGASSGSILATDNIYYVSLGSLLGGPGSGSGQIFTGGNITYLYATGGSSATTVSGIVNVTGNAYYVSVHGDIAGSGDSTGLFQIGGTVVSFNVSGALRGGSGLDSGSIFAGLDDTGSITYLTVSGGIIGGSGQSSGQVFTGGGIAYGSVGDIVGGGGQSSGSIVSNGALGYIAVAGSAPTVTTHGIIGGAGAGSGQISAGTTITSVTLKGALQGGSGPGSGSIVSNSLFAASGDIQGNIGAISINGGIIGGAGADSGQISAAGNLSELFITGSVTGSLASGSGAILAGADLTGLTGGNITLLEIGGALQGASVPNGTGTVTGSGYVEAGHIGSAIIGSIQAGSVGSGDTVFADGAILAANDIASLTVTGAAGIAGTSSNSVSISAVGQLTPGAADLAFGRISVTHAVSYANFLAGYDQTLTPVNGAASIGSVIVGGNWSGSNLIAGVEPATAGGPYGGSVLITPGIIPTIASIIIEGHVVSAPPAAAGAYGFVSGKIEAFSLHGVAQSVALGLMDPDDPSHDTVLRDA